MQPLSQVKLHRLKVTRSITCTAPLALLALAVLLYAAYFSYLTILRYHAFEARALDMGNLHQAIWNTAHGNWFRMTNQEPGLTSRLSMHVEPILLPIAGIYRLFPGVETLLILQATVVALGALPIFALARRLQLGDWLALAFAVTYLLNPTIQAANWLEFHPVTLAPTFLMSAFYFLVARTPRSNIWFVVFAVLAASCKEEMGLLVAMLGIYAAIMQRRWRFGVFTFVLAAGWSLLAVLGIQAAFAGGNIHWGRYAYLGETTTDKVFALLTRPDLIVAQLQSAGIGRYFFELLLPVGFLSLLAPEVLLLALPSFAINLLAQFSPMHQVTTLIYAAPVLPFVMLSAVQGAARLLGWLAPHQPSASSAHSLTFSPFYPLAHHALALYLLTAALVSQVLYGYLPFGSNHMPLAVTAHHERSAVIFDQIPTLAGVSAQDRLNPHVAGRPTVHIFPRVEQADFVVLDVTGSAWPQHPNDLKQSVDDLLATGFGIAAADDGYLLLQRGAITRTLTPATYPAFYTAWQTPPEAQWTDQAPSQMAAPAAGTSSSDIAAAPIAIFGDLLRLDDYRVRTDRYGETVVDLTWTALAPLPDDLRFYVGYFASKGQALYDNIYYQPVSVLWYPTSLWPQGERTYVQTLPWRLDAAEFVLSLGVFEGDDGWASGARLPVTANGGAPTLENGTLLRLGGFTRRADGGWQETPAVGADYAALPLRGLDAALGGELRLSAAAVPASVQAGASLPIRLQWERTGEAAPNLSRFVHLRDAAGNTVAQVDGPVTDAFGPLPVEGWPLFTLIEDLPALAVPPTLPGGDYTLVAGLYDWQTGATVGSDGGVQLGTVHIVK
jgi:uncharacterized membrane protein